MVEWGLECGVTHFIIEIETAGILPLVQLHFQPMPLGLPCKVRGRDIIAVIVVFDKRTLQSFRQLCGSQKRALPPPPRPAYLHA